MPLHHPARATMIALTLAIASCGGGSTPDGVDAASIVDCTTGAPCGADGETCTTATERCACAAHGSSLVCESSSCPATPVSSGTPCTTDGLTCDPDFEFAGFRCTGPENVFVECLPGGTIDSRCPAALPAEGAPCCWVIDGLEPCTYAADPGQQWSCAGSHWLRAPMT